MTDPVHVTPTEDLLMEILAARYRLGEHLWTFDLRHKKPLERLEAKGLVTVLHGIVDQSLRASMTQAGIDTYVSKTYESPLETKLKIETDRANLFKEKYERAVTQL